LATAGGVAVGTQAIAANQTLSATTAVNIRSSASTSGAILGVLYQGQKIEATGPSKNGWTPVTFRGRTAYVYSSYLVSQGGASSGGTVTGSARTMKTTANLNVRSGPSTSSSIVGVVNKGGSVSLTGSTQGNWAQITYGGQKRWVAAGYLTAGSSISVKSTGITTAAVNVRASSTASSTRIATIPSGTIVQLTGATANGFTQIVWQGVARWIVSTTVKAYSASQPTSNSSAGSTSTGSTRYTTANLNIRQTSSPGSKVVAVAPTGMALQLTGKVANNLAQVRYNGGLYWASLSYLTTTAPKATSYNGGGSVGLAGLTSSAKGIVSTVRANFPQIVTFYGVRQDPLPDHPSGRAVDAMLPNWKSNNALGWKIANYLRANASKLDIQYIIFDQKIWNISRNSEGWRPMADRGSATANHKDHVHVTVKS
jgi:uncharacterized protein YgiM (DUF1202 family)